jgi:hypothetical protein
MGLKTSTVHIERMGENSSLEIVGKASASPRPLAIGRYNQDLAERESRASCSPQTRRLDAIIVGDEN